MNEEQKGNKIAKKVWYWVQSQKAIQYAPWVLNLESSELNILKKTKQEVRNELLEELEDFILEVSKE